MINSLGWVKTIKDTYNELKILFTERIDETTDVINNGGGSEMVNLIDLESGGGQTIHQQSKDVCKNLEYPISIHWIRTGCKRLRMRTRLPYLRDKIDRYVQKNRTNMQPTALEGVYYHRRTGKLIVEEGSSFDLYAQECITSSFSHCKAAYNRQCTKESDHTTLNDAEDWMMSSDDDSDSSEEDDNGRRNREKDVFSEADTEDEDEDEEDEEEEESDSESESSSSSSSSDEGEEIRRTRRGTYDDDDYESDSDDGKGVSKGTSLEDEEEGGGQESAETRVVGRKRKIATLEDSGNSNSRSSATVVERESAVWVPRVIILNKSLYIPFIVHSQNATKSANDQDF